MERGYSVSFLNGELIVGGDGTQEVDTTSNLIVQNLLSFFPAGAANLHETRLFW